ncbi:MAG: type III pantothenate kinase [Chlorobiales bacterium]|nr:type III pantothenate kinase [Chlorobiales bacterium]
MSGINRKGISLKRENPSSTSSGVKNPLVLAIDIGNTGTRAGFFVGKKLIGTFRVKTETILGQNDRADFFAELSAELELLGKMPAQIAVSSVVPKAAKVLVPALEKTFKLPVLQVSAALKLPFKIGYKTPQTLGADRIAFCASAVDHRKDEAIIAIDFGTAITYDILSADCTYLGGLILAGAGLNASALHQHTAQLPEVQLKAGKRIIGQSTQECLENGLYWGTVAQTEALIGKLKKEIEETCGSLKIKVVATGGDSRLMKKGVKKIDMQDDFAVLRGIAVIARLNR